MTQTGGFVRALLNDGELGARRILSAESVAMMGSNQIGEVNMRQPPSTMPALYRDDVPLPGPPDKFGFGVALNSRPSAEGRGVNTMWWAGIFNTFFWIDREKQVGGVFLTQLLPFMDADATAVALEFERAVYQLDRRSSR